MSCWTSHFNWIADRYFQPAGERHSQGVNEKCIINSISSISVTVLDSKQQLFNCITRLYCPIRVFPAMISKDGCQKVRFGKEKRGLKNVKHSWKDEIFYLVKMFTTILNGKISIQHKSCERKTLIDWMKVSHSYGWIAEKVELHSKHFTVGTHSLFIFNL